MSDNKSIGGDFIRSEGAAGIEPEPAEPKKTGAEYRHRQVMGQHHFSAMSLALADHEANDQTGYAGNDMDDCSAGEIENSHFPEPTADTPDPMRYRIVDESGPDQGEKSKSGKLHPFCKSSSDERGSDDREHSVENHEG